MRNIILCEILSIFTQVPSGVLRHNDVLIAYFFADQSSLEFKSLQDVRSSS